MKHYKFTSILAISAFFASSVISIGHCGRDFSGTPSPESTRTTPKSRVSAPSTPATPQDELRVVKTKVRSLEKELIVEKRTSAANLTKAQKALDAEKAKVARLTRELKAAQTQGDRDLEAARQAEEKARAELTRLTTELQTSQTQTTAELEAAQKALDAEKAKVARLTRSSKTSQTQATAELEAAQKALDAEKAKVARLTRSSKTAQTKAVAELEAAQKALDAEKAKVTRLTRSSKTAQTKAVTELEAAQEAEENAQAEVVRLTEKSTNLEYELDDSYHLTVDVLGNYMQQFVQTAETDEQAHFRGVLQQTLGFCFHSQGFPVQGTAQSEEMNQLVLDTDMTVAFFAPRTKAEEVSSMPGVFSVIFPGLEMESELMGSVADCRTAHLDYLESTTSLALATELANKVRTLRLATNKAQEFDAHRSNALSLFMQTLNENKDNALRHVATLEAKVNSLAQQMEEADRILGVMDTQTRKKTKGELKKLTLFGIDTSDIGGGNKEEELATLRTRITDKQTQLHVELKSQQDLLHTAKKATSFIKVQKGKGLRRDSTMVDLAAVAAHPGSRRGSSAEVTPLSRGGSMVLDGSPLSVQKGSGMMHVDNVDGDDDGAVDGMHDEG